MAFTSTTNPWSGKSVLLKYMNPTKSKVVNKTIEQITRAILIFWIKVTVKNTTANARSKF